MNLSNLSSVEGSRHYPKRLGRGRGSGLGQTSAKGHKGQLARTGGRVRRGFEGGQSPLSRRMPKRGFSNRAFSAEKVTLRLDQVVNKIPQGSITIDSLKAAGFSGDSFKIVGGPDSTSFTQLDKKLLARDFAVPVSTGVETIIQSAGGRVVKSL
ncbi:MAG: 50S ribosomal protein L15 [Bdellovibrionaceae bacterium]|jgi:large subunit ribosomal protein L15|nr:50S ribosomal protein L15 [Pseudobdellovibrionaceae bacterium]